MSESDTVIRVENLSKRYVISHAAERGSYSTLRDTLADGAKALGRRLFGRDKNAPDPRREEFWALKDVSFEVKRGEVVGIIGRNGAGKSTLLKILSRITEPTGGQIEIDGRVASLLEVGTGFHPELTGRENVFLNGAILGMSRVEIKRKFDEIVAFAEVEKFLDTPVKRYSSGMYMRLAFAVAAHLDPEILIVDEVLAVGDSQFQKKCLGKMGEVAKGGRTVLFVSHNMAAVIGLCSRCIWLSDGVVAGDGVSGPVIRDYSLLTRDTTTASVNLENRRTSRGLAETRMMSVTLYDRDGRACRQVETGASLKVSVRFCAPSVGLRPVLGIVIKDQYGTCLSGNNNRVTPGYDLQCSATHGVISVTYQSVPLLPGHYNLDLYLGNEAADLDTCLDAITIEVLPADILGSGKLPPPSAGPIFIPAVWSLSQAI